MKLILLGIIFFCIFSSAKLIEGIDISTAEGDTGEDGPKGRRGPPGKQGRRGPKGRDAHSSDVGWQGQTGPRGDVGIIGEIGFEGARGPKGFRGNKGPIGKKKIDNIWSNDKLKHSLVDINRNLLKINKDMKNKKKTPIHLNLVVPNNESVHTIQKIEAFNNYIYQN
jgi:hypothetical protein